MNPKKELQVAYILAIIMFVVGVISYTAFSAPSPDEPIRIMFKTVAGKVLFDHKTHLADSNCSDCHHHPEDDESGLQACGNCHQTLEEGETVPKSCLEECHEIEDVEGTEMSKKSDAFHSQCEDCHKESDIGPGPEDRCGWCHINVS